MEFDDRIYENIGKYLKGTLLGTELSEFERELVLNSQLEKAVEAERLLSKLLVDKELLDYKNMLANVHRKEVKNSIIKKIWIPTVSALLFFGITTWYFRNNTINHFNVNQKESLISLIYKLKDQKDTTLVKNPNYSQLEKKSIVQIVDNDKITTVRNIDTISGNLLPNANENKISVYNSDEVESTHANSSTTFTTKPINKYLEQPTKNICNNVQMSVEYKITNTCKNEAIGGVFIDKVSGGVKPHTIVVLDIQNQTKQINNQLEAGQYIVYVNDANNCGSNKNIVVVNEKDCNENFHINTSISETFTVPNNYKACAIKIVDKAGNVYFSKNLQNGELFEWDGHPSAGQFKAGYYLYQVTFEDGSISKGTITISE